MSTQEWDTRVEHAEVEQLRAENERLIRRCAHLQTKVMLAAGALELANGSLGRAVQRIDELEADQARLLADLLIDRAFDGPMGAA